ncbi:GntR family transcriptional regulator [Phaeobacter sp. J2-8]|uniref:GntR family transcriptional regulator n=1 Tax=Phaeobacter sp. J2-8 TaxID=2931394 RepID=UPI001FD0A6A2|nr:GntR family transcriptional regulator [Phaeobacter sp. J2-8]
MNAKRKIYEYLTGEIASGRVKTGGRMATEKELAAQFSVSRSTIQAVMSQLVSEGYVRRQAGKGTFACQREDDMRVRVNLDIHNIQSFENEAAVSGERVTYRLISFSRIAAPARAAAKLGLDLGTDVFSLHRLRFIDKLCIGMEIRYFSPALTLDFPATALETEGVHSLIEDVLDIRISRIEAALRAEAATAADAAHLGLAPHAPLLVRSHTLFDTSEQVILHGDSYYVQPFSFRYTASVRN